MRRSLFVLCVLVLLTLVPDPAQAADACSVTQARDDARAARRAMVRATVRYREAVRILEATVRYGDQYGTVVGRWSRLARRVGWPWAQFPTLMYVIDRESGGRAGVFNYEGSGCAGLLQLAPCHYQGRFDPTDPRRNLSYGLRLWRGSGWSPWSL